MRVLYIASNVDGQEDLGLEREITELQGRFVTASGEAVAFTFLPDMRIENLAAAISANRPEILHISSHASTEYLSIANSNGKPVKIDARKLKILLDEDALPKLIYLNSCDSQQIAKDLVSLVPMAIGTTFLITNRAARAGAVQFYERILQGRSVRNAFEASQAIIETLEEGKTSTEIYAKTGVDPSIELLHQNPRLVASFIDDKFLANKEGDYRFKIGVIGCPRTTSQLIMFTDDSSFVVANRSLEEAMCSVSLERPSKGVLWIQESWSAPSDFKLFACGVTSDDRSFVSSAMICDALETYYKLRYRDPLLLKLPDEAKKAIKNLRMIDSADTLAQVADLASGDAPPTVKPSAVTPVRRTKN